MSEPTFPADRFAKAGATPDELAQLELEFERSDLTVQTSMMGYFASISNTAVADYLQTLREAGHFGAVATEEPEADEQTSEADTGNTEPLAAVSTPASGRGATAKSAGNAESADKDTGDAPAAE